VGIEPQEDAIGRTIVERRFFTHDDADSVSVAQ
jgi:hypothetical protein